MNEGVAWRVVWGAILLFFSLLLLAWLAAELQSVIVQLLLAVLLAAAASPVVEKLTGSHVQYGRRRPGRGPSRGRGLPGWRAAARAWVGPGRGDRGA